MLYGCLWLRCRAGGGLGVHMSVDFLDISRFSTVVLTCVISASTSERLATNR